jgi:peptidoglycan/LPS O-acetylase OafA/YrhL
MAIWFTPRIELLPVSGTVFPLEPSWEDDPVDQAVTVSFFLLNIFFIGLGIWGAWRLWRWNRAVRPALITLGAFLVLRTVFLTTLETPEPRYTLVCFPVILALGATVFGKPFNNLDKKR